MWHRDDGCCENNIAEEWSADVEGFERLKVTGGGERWSWVCVVSD